jgi:hypothetical protein
MDQEVELAGDVVEKRVGAGEVAGLADGGWAAAGGADAEG